MKLSTIQAFKLSNFLLAAGLAVFSAESAFAANVTVRVAAGQESSGTVSGGKANAREDSTLTLKATANKGYAFAGWFSDKDSAVSTGGGILVSYAESWKYTVTGDDVTFFAKFVSAKDDALELVDLMQGEPVPVAIGQTPQVAVDVAGSGGDRSVPAITVSGLPSGVSYVKPGSDSAIGTFKGAAKKPGVSYVTFKATNKNGYEHSLVQKWIVDPSTTDPAGTDFDRIGIDWDACAGGNEDEDRTTTGLFDMQTGKKCAVSLLLPGYTDEELRSISKFAVSGLPSGVAFEPVAVPYWGMVGSIVGYPEKPGVYTAKFAATFIVNGKKVDKAAQRTIVVADSGCRYVSIATAKAWQGLGTAEKSGVYRIGGTIPLSAKATAKNTFFGGWFLDEACSYEDRASAYVEFSDDCYLPSRDNRNAKDVMTFYLEMAEKHRLNIFARFVRQELSDQEDEITEFGIETNGGPDDEEFLHCFHLWEGVDGEGPEYIDYWVRCLTHPTVTAKNLPPGVTLDTKGKCLRLTKSKAKPGMKYEHVMLTAKNETGHSKTLDLTICMDNLESDIVTSVDYEHDAYRLMVGQDIDGSDIALWLNEDIYGDGGWKISASDLPPGIAFAGVEANGNGHRLVLAGWPTKAGVYAPVFTFTRGSGAAKETKQFSFTVSVGDMPEELTGTFNGLTSFASPDLVDPYGDIRPESRVVTITSKAGGAVTAKVGKQSFSSNLGRGWQLREDGDWEYDLYTSATKENGQSVVYHLHINATTEPKAYGAYGFTGTISKLTTGADGVERSELVEDGVFFTRRDVLTTDETLAQYVTELVKKGKVMGFKLSGKLGYTPGPMGDEAYTLVFTTEGIADFKAKVTAKGIVQIGGKVDGQKVSCATTLYPVYDEDEGSLTFYGCVPTAAGKRAALVSVCFGFWPNGDGVLEFVEKSGSVYLR